MHIKNHHFGGKFKTKCQKFSNNFSSFGICVQAQVTTLKWITTALIFFTSCLSGIVLFGNYKRDFLFGHLYIYFMVRARGTNFLFWKSSKKSRNVRVLMKKGFLIGVRNYGPPQVKCQLLISSIFYAMDISQKCHKLNSSISKKCRKFSI